MTTEYQKMYEAAQQLEGKTLKVFYLDRNGHARVIFAELLKYLECPANGSVMFDANLNENVSVAGFKTKQQDPNQSWTYKLEFGTSIYNNLVNGSVLKNQACNSLWVDYVNPFGMKSSKNSLKLLKLEFCR